MEHPVTEHGPSLKKYAQAVRESPHNLMSRAGLDELETRHIPESVRFAARLPGPGLVLDIGSGGGLPGLVIAIVRPDLDVHLVEATAKKADFLSDTASRIGVRVVVHNSRAEELAVGELRGAFPIVTARAVAALPRLVELCQPFLAPGGRLYAIKGQRWPDEITDATSVMRRLGIVVAGTPADVPDLDPMVVVLERLRGA